MADKQSSWKALKGKNYLVTGAAGGVGAVLVQKLLEADATVFAVDDLSSGSWANLSNENHSGLQTCTASIADLNSLTSSCESGGPFDAVVHLAAISSLPACESYPDQALTTNVVGTANVIELARRLNIGFICNASTSAVYENTKVLPFRETQTVKPTLLYPQTKLFGEQMMDAAAIKFGLIGCNLRFFNLFGPFQDFRRQSPPLLNYLVRQAVAGDTALLHSDGLQERDYVSTESACDAIARALSWPGPGFATWNVASSQTLSVRRFVELVEEGLGEALDVIYREASRLWDGYPQLTDSPMPLDEDVVERETVKRSAGSYQLINETLGWEPDADLAGSVMDAAAKVRENIEAWSDSTPGKA